jgi:hypothetical protein
MNYLEELACWYFRFNGYFLIQNFVNHRNDVGMEDTHDTDFLGVRFPNVSEHIGGNNVDFDQRIISNNKIMCVIGEAKSGENYRPAEIFASKKVLKENIFRLGILSAENVTDGVIEHLFTHNYWEYDNYKIIKVLVAEVEKQDEKYLYISKDEIINEINRRKAAYRKNLDRLYFNSNLIQYLFS